MKETIREISQHGCRSGRRKKRKNMEEDIQKINDDTQQ